MRAYVITEYDHTDPHGVESRVVSVTSSKKHAIEACEHALDGLPGGASVKWHNKSKHTGHAHKGDIVAAYEMFFVNRTEVE